MGLPLEFSVSATSRAMRPGEVDGRDYCFLTPVMFRQKIEQNQFVEWEEVYAGSYYGTLKSELERIWAAGKHVLFDVDVVGGVNLKKQFGDQALSIFIKPPSVKELENRLRNRSTETEESLLRRLGKAEEELSYEQQFDAVVVNDVLDEAVQEAYDRVYQFIV